MLKSCIDTCAFCHDLVECRQPLLEHEHASTGLHTVTLPCGGAWVDLFRCAWLSSASMISTLVMTRLDVHICASLPAMRIDSPAHGEASWRGCARMMDHRSIDVVKCVV